MRFLVIILSIVVLVSCKKDKDNQKPVIQITSPVNYQSVDALDTISIIGEVRDERNLEYVRISLRDQNDIPVLSSVSKFPDGSSYRLNIPYYFDDIHLESGTYYFDISASDGENTTHLFVHIQLNEEPIRTLGLFVSGMNGSNSEVIDLDTSLTFRNSISFNGDHIGIAANSYDQQLIKCGGLTGDLNALSFDGLTTMWNRSNYDFKGHMQYDREQFVGFYDGTIISYDHFGNGSFNALAYTNCYAEEMLVSNDFFIAEQVEKGSGNVRLVTYYYPYGTIKQQITLNEDIINMFPYSSNEIVLFSNNGGVGKVRLYNTFNNQSYEPFSLAAGAVTSCVEVSPGVYVITQNSNIYRVNLNNSTSNLILSGINANLIGYDKVNDHLVVIDGANCSLYNYGSLSLINSYVAPNAITDVSFYYNK